MKKVYEIVCRIEKILAMTGILLMTVFIFLGAVSRVANHPFGWTSDLGTFMLAWSTFLGGDIAFREGRLANLDAFIRKLPVKAQKAVAVLVYAIIIVFLVCLVYFGAKLTYTSRFRTFNGVKGFSYSWVTVCMPITGVFMLVTAVGRLAKLLRSEDPAEIARM
ncbi:MAG: TRAP transporter small permease [Clostridiales bacterium]|nr:TRAP transporter small permease [Clostridiales bacterium]